MWAECRNRLADEAAEAAADGTKGKSKKGNGKRGRAAGANQRDTCNYCQKKGHKEAQCRKKQEDQKQGGPLAATAQQSEPEPPPTVPIKALQLTEGEVHERVQHGFLLPLAQADAKVSQIEAELEQLDRLHLRSAPLRRAMVDTGAGASVFPRGFSKHSVPDTNRGPVTLTTATGEEITVNDGRCSSYTLPAGAPVQIRHHESDVVTDPVISVSETAAAGNWTIFGPGIQKFLGPDSTQQIEQMLSRVDSVDMVKSRGVYWLELENESSTAIGWPLCAAEASSARQSGQEEQTELSTDAASSDAHAVRSAQ